MTRVFVHVTILAAAAALASGFALQGYRSAAIGMVLAGIIWAVANLRGFYRINSLAFALFVFISVASIWAGVYPWLALACVTFSLAAWDLAMFYQRLQMTGDKADRQKMERAHLVRLALVVGLGSMGYLTATRIRIGLTFGGAALLALLGIWGISALVYRLRSHE